MPLPNNLFNHTDEDAPIRVAGLMSGTSFDGLDICLVEFSGKPDKPDYKILSAETRPYPSEIENLLRNLEQTDGDSLIKGHLEYGKYLGLVVRDFIQSSGYHAHLVASHGHTIFHRPDKGYTFQAGHGQPIAQHCKLPVVCDFRTADVLLGGQGAPLVPFGDASLFNGYDACLNLGGFANITLMRKDPPVAFDICPVNYVLNALALRSGQAYDEGGKMASVGQIDEKLLYQLEALPYYRMQPPKSLGREWVYNNIYPLLETTDTTTALRTFTEHAAKQIAAKLPPMDKLLITGGGAYNDFLVTCLRKKAPQCKIIIPADTLVAFKEALIFAFLGYRYALGLPNIDGRITGSHKLHSSGVMFLP